jgi:hypothetical protein
MAEVRSTIVCKNHHSAVVSQQGDCRADRPILVQRAVLKRAVMEVSTLADCLQLSISKTTCLGQLISVKLFGRDGTIHIFSLFISIYYLE